MKTHNRNDSVGIIVTDDAIGFAEYMLPSWRVVLLVLAGVFLSMPLCWSTPVTWLIGGVPAAWLAFIALRRRVISIDLRHNQVVVKQGLIVPFHEVRRDLGQFIALTTDTRRVHNFQENGSKPTQTVTKTFILDGAKPCLLCRRGYGGNDKELEAGLWDVEKHLKSVLKPRFSQGT